MNLSAIYFIEIFKNLPPELSTFLLAIIPITELRASIPIALSVYGLPVFSAMFFSILGDMIPIFIVLVGMEKVYRFVSRKSKCGKKFFDWFFSRTKNKFKGKYAKYGSLALILFVALPFPFTGSWSGSAAAFIFRIPFVKSFPLIFTGILISAILVTLISIGVIAVI